MPSLPKLVALLSITGTLCLSSVAYATSDNSVKEVHNAGDHELSDDTILSPPAHSKFSGDDNIKSKDHPIIDENSAWNEKAIDRKVTSNEQDSHPKPVPASVYLNDHSASSVPEPEIYAMLVAGVSLLGYIVRRKKNDT